MNGRRIERLCKGPPTGVWCALLVLLSAELASACSTPVYVYTLYNWMRDPYRVYYFYRDAQPEADAAVNGYLEKVSMASGGHCNLVLSKVDVSGLKGAEGRSFAQQVWNEHRSKKLPFHAVFTPRGYELFVGRLDLGTAKALVSSPKRKQMAQQLCAGKHGLLLVLRGKDAGKSAEAEAVARQVVALAKEHEQDVGMLTVARNDRKELWLVRQLLRLEEDLESFDSPMVFGVFGRAHVVEPYLGRGITEENIAELAYFMGAPCSCTIKTADLGMDLLTDWDWDSRIADLDPMLDGPPQWTLFDIEDDAADDVKVESAVADTTADAPKPAASGGRPGEEKAGDSPPKRPEPSAPSGEASDRAEPDEPTDAREEVAAPGRVEAPFGGAAGREEWDLARAAETAFGGERPETAFMAAEEEGPSFTLALARRVAVGVGAALLVVAGAGLLLLKRAKREA